MFLCFYCLCYFYFIFYLISIIIFIFFCTFHWADLSWPTFHYWLYPVWLCMWQIIKNLEPWNTCFTLIQQVGYLIRSTCCFTEMSDPFVSDATWVGSCFFGGFVWKHVVPLKSLLLLRDVTGKPCWSTEAVWCWFCIEMESVVMLMVPRCYGFYKVLDSPRWFVSADVKARVQRTGFRVVLARVGERWRGEARENEHSTGALF